MALIKTGSISKIALATSKDTTVQLEVASVIEQKKEGCIYFRARAISAGDQGPKGIKWNYNGNLDYFAKKELLKSYHTFPGRNLFLNHDTSNPLKAVGKVLDSYPVEDPETGEFYIECLARIDKNLHRELAGMIENGDLNSVSMGASCGSSMCSVCGSTIHSDQDTKCAHLNRLGQQFDAEVDMPDYGIVKGQRVPAFCINSDLTFSELSIVSIPADSAALIKTVIAAFSDRIKKTAAKDGSKSAVAALDIILGLLSPSDREAVKQQICASVGSCKVEAESKKDQYGNKTDWRWEGDMNQMLHYHGNAGFAVTSEGRCAECGKKAPTPLEAHSSTDTTNEGGFKVGDEVEITNKPEWTSTKIRSISKDGDAVLLKWDEDGENFWVPVYNITMANKNTDLNKKADLLKTAAAYDVLVYALNLSEEDKALASLDLFNAMVEAGFSTGRTKDGKAERQVFYTALHAAVNKGWVKQAEPGVYALTEAGQARAKELGEWLGEDVIPGHGKIGPKDEKAPEEKTDKSPDASNPQMAPDQAEMIKPDEDKAKEETAPALPEDQKEIKNIWAGKSSEVDTILSKLSGLEYERLQEHMTQKMKAKDNSMENLKAEGTPEVTKVAEVPANLNPHEEGMPEAPAPEMAKAEEMAAAMPAPEEAKSPEAEHEAKEIDHAKSEVQKLDEATKLIKEVKKEIKEDQKADVAEEAKEEEKAAPAAEEKPSEEPAKEPEASAAPTTQASLNKVATQYYYLAEEIAYAGRGFAKDDKGSVEASSPEEAFGKLLQELESDRFEDLEDEEGGEVDAATLSWKTPTDWYNIALKYLSMDRMDSPFAYTLGQDDWQIVLADSPEKMKQHHKWEGVEEKPAEEPEASAAPTTQASLNKVATQYYYKADQHAQMQWGGGRGVGAVEASSPEEAIGKVLMGADYAWLFEDMENEEGEVVHPTLTTPLDYYKVATTMTGNVDKMDTPYGTELAWDDFHIAVSDTKQKLKQHYDAMTGDDQSQITMTEFTASKKSPMNTSTKKPTLTAKFNKQPFLSRSSWTVFSEDKPILTATLKDICGDHLKEMKALVTSTEYGDRLIARINADGLDKIAALLSAKIEVKAESPEASAVTKEAAKEEKPSEVKTSYEAGEHLVAKTEEKAVEKKAEACPCGKPACTCEMSKECACKMAASTPEVSKEASKESPATLSEAEKPSTEPEGAKSGQAWDKNKNMFNSDKVESDEAKGKEIGKEAKLEKGEMTLSEAEKDAAHPTGGIKPDLMTPVPEAKATKEVGKEAKLEPGELTLDKAEKPAAPDTFKPKMGTESSIPSDEAKAKEIGREAALNQQIEDAQKKVQQLEAALNQKAAELDQEKVERSIEAKMIKCRKLVEEMVRKDLLAENQETVEKYLKQGQNLLDARKSAIRETVDLQLASFMQMPDSLLKVQAETITRMKKTAAPTSDKLRIPVQGQFNADSGDADWLQNLPWS